MYHLLKLTRSVSVQLNVIQLEENRLVLIAPLSRKKQLIFAFVITWKSDKYDDTAHIHRLSHRVPLFEPVHGDIISKLHTLHYLNRIKKVNWQVSGKSTWRSVCWRTAAGTWRLFDVEQLRRRKKRPRQQTGMCGGAICNQRNDKQGNKKEQITSSWWRFTQKRATYTWGDYDLLVFWKELPPQRNNYHFRLFALINRVSCDICGWALRGREVWRSGREEEEEEEEEEWKQNKIKAARHIFHCVPEIKHSKTFMSF